MDRTRDYPPPEQPRKSKGLDLRLAVLLLLFGLVGVVGILFIGRGAGVDPVPVADPSPPPTVETAEILPNLGEEATPEPVVEARTPARPERTPAPVRKDPTPAVVADASTPIADLPEPTVAPIADLPIIQSTPAPAIVHGGRPGKLNVKRSPVSLLVYVDGEKIGQTPIFGYELPPGQHSVRMKDPQTGKYSPVRTVTIPAGGKKAIGWYDFRTSTWKD